MKILSFFFLIFLMGCNNSNSYSDTELKDLTEDQLVQQLLNDPLFNTYAKTRDEMGYVSEFSEGAPSGDKEFKKDFGRLKKAEEDLARKYKHVIKADVEKFKRAINKSLEIKKATK